MSGSPAAPTPAPTPAPMTRRAPAAAQDATAPTAAPELLILSTLKARRGAGGGLIMTQKYLDGVAEYAKTWPGPVTTLVGLDTRPGVDMDQVETGLNDPTYALELRPEAPEPLSERLQRAALVLMQLAPEEEEAAALCHALGKPVVFVSEYTPRTERQIMALATPNPLRRLRRRVYIAGAERKRQRMLRRHAAGVQCSGTPVFDLYSPFAQNPLLFFDNRVRRADIISDTDFAAKWARITAGGPLRLVFGGRLTAMKGVLDLPRVAQALSARGVAYQMDIYGSGDQEAALAAAITQGGLSETVRLLPPMDFVTGWVPRLKEEADLFVCCHPQGDPSSTYSEVMSCGVPIVGYGNEAFAGVIRMSGAGWQVPVGDTQVLATQIAQLDQDRQALQNGAAQGRDFMQAHCFELTFAKRVDHMRTIAGLHSGAERGPEA